MLLRRREDLQSSLRLLDLSASADQGIVDGQISCNASALHAAKDLQCISPLAPFALFEDMLAFVRTVGIETETETET